MRVANNIETIARGGHSWDITTSYPGYLGPSALQALPDTGTTITDNIGLSSPSIELEVKFQNPGTYWIWGRGQSLSADDNSYHVGLDGYVNPDFSATQMRVDPDWAWCPYKGPTQTVSRGTLVVPTPGVHRVQIYMREDGCIMDSLFLTQDVDATPTDSTPESPESVNLGEVRLSDAGADGATVHATFAGYAEDVLPDGYELEIEGFATVATLPYVASGVSDTALPDTPVLSRSLDVDGSTIHLTATLVTDNGTQFAPRARGVVNGSAVTDWVDSTPIELTPSGVSSYLFERRENGGNWTVLGSVPPANPTIIDDTDGWSGLIEHRVRAVDVAANSGDWSNVVSTQSGQVTTVTVARARGAN